MGLLLCIDALLISYRLFFVVVILKVPIKIEQGLFNASSGWFELLPEF
jgi:hypothetical protein